MDGESLFNCQVAVVSRRVLSLHRPFSPPQGADRDCYSFRSPLVLLPDEARMAEQQIFEESVLGPAARYRIGRRLVWADALASWLEIHRSIYYSASLRAIYL